MTGWAFVCPVKNKIGETKMSSVELEVVRCCDCQALNTSYEIKQYGMCRDCGNKRMRNVLMINQKEYDDLKKKGVSDSFFELFEGVDSE